MVFGLLKLRLYLDHEGFYLRLISMYVLLGLLLSKVHQSVRSFFYLNECKL